MPLGALLGVHIQLLSSLYIMLISHLLPLPFFAPKLSLADVLADPQGSQALDTSVPHRCPISLTAASPHPDISLHP